MRGGFRVAILLFILVSFLSACGDQSILLESLFPESAALPTWAPTGKARVYNYDGLYDLVNGQADAFFAYAFEQVAVRSYEHDGGAELRVEIWQLATPADAYGLFSTFRSGSPIEVGNEGAGDPERSIVYWQDQYFVRLDVSQEAPGSHLEAVAESVSDLLPAGGQPPALLDRLPQEGLLEQSRIFFHQELSIQDYLWLGGQNILGLGPETDGVLARYDGGAGAVYLVLIQYPTIQSANAAFKALQETASSDLVASQVQDGLLASVFGVMSDPLARSLLQDVFAEK